MLKKDMKIRRELFAAVVVVEVEPEGRVQAAVGAGRQRRLLRGALRRALRPPAPLHAALR